MTYTMIPDESLLMTILVIIGVALGTFLVLYLVAFQEKKTKVLEAKQKALASGIAVDEIELAKVESFHNIYLASMLIGTAITVAVSYCAMITIMPDLVTLDSTPAYCMYGAIVTIVAGLVLDRYFCHPIADGTFKTKVIDPIVDKAIAEFQGDSSSEGALTAEQKQKLVEFLSKL